MATPNIVPRADSEGNLGTSSKFWLRSYLDGLTIGNDAAGNITFAPSENDSVTLAAAANGAFTITTTDGGGTNAHFEIAANGNIILDAAADIEFQAGGNDINMDTDNCNIESATSGKPLVTLKCTNTTSATSGELKFLKDAADTEDGEDLGKISFYGEDEGNNATEFSRISSEIQESDEGDEAGRFDIKVSNDNTLQNAFRATADKALTTVVSTSVGNGAKGTHEIAGSTTIYGNKGLSLMQDLIGVTFENTYGTLNADISSGHVIRYGTSEVLTLGGLYFLHTDGSWDATDADAVATGASQMLGIACGDPAEHGIIIGGLVRIPSTEILNTPGSGAVDGLPVYVSTTPSHFDFTAPTGSGDFVRAVGYAIDDSSGDVLINFNPDKSWVELA